MIGLTIRRKMLWGCYHYRGNIQDHHGSGRHQQADRQGTEAGAEILHPDPQAQGRKRELTRNGVDFLSLQDSPSDILVSTRLILTKTFH